MKNRIASIDDLDLLYEFYNEVIDNQINDEYTPSWTKDVYPSKDDIKYHLLHNTFHILEEDDVILACLALTDRDDEMYKKANWSIKNDDDIAVIHLLAVNPKYRNRGIAKELLKYIIENINKKAIHLDVMKGNVAAFNLYKSLGFKYIGEYEVYYEDTGKITVDLMEYII